jgi:hypothetical protein
LGIVSLVNKAGRIIINIDYPHISAFFISPAPQAHKQENEIVAVFISPESK